MVAGNETKPISANNAEPEEEEDLIDIQDTLKETCSQKSECQSFKSKLDECNDRVNSRSNTAETCIEELFDFVHCVDHCVSKELFKSLK